jgi:hypothetical protein
VISLNCNIFLSKEFSCDSNSVHQLHADVCRSEEPAESNIIYDYSLPQEKVMAVKYSDRSYYPARMRFSQNLKLFAPTSSPIFAYPPETAKFVMSDDLFSAPQSALKPKSGWGTWKTISSCRSGCLASSKGLRLVQRDCESGTCGSGSSRSVQLCIPNEQVSLNFFFI